MLIFRGVYLDHFSPPLPLPCMESRPPFAKRPSLQRMPQRFGTRQHPWCYERKFVGGVARVWGYNKSISYPVRCPLFLYNHKLSSSSQLFFIISHIHRVYFLFSTLQMFIAHSPLIHLCIFLRPDSCMPFLLIHFP